MLALVLGIASAAGWIIFDVAISIVTYPLMPTCEWWIFVLSGVALVTVTVAAQILEYRGRERVEKRQSNEHAVIATGTLAIFERLAAVTQTTGQSATITLEATILKIDALTRQVADLSESSRHVTRDQRRRFADSLPKTIPDFYGAGALAHHGVRIIHGSTLEAQNYAEELQSLFGEQGFTVTREENVTHESLNIPGLQMLIADPSNPTASDKITKALLDAAKIEYEIEQSITGFPQATTLRVGRASAHRSSE
jgi:hypothetical protein